MARLTKYEKETIILFNEGEDKASIYTYNAGLRNRLAAFSRKYPDLCRLEKSCDQGGVSYVRSREKPQFSHSSATADERGTQTKSK